MSGDVTQTVGQIVRGAMAERGVTQQQVADALGMTQSQVSRRLSGQIEFDVAELRTVAQLLGVPVADLLPELEIQVAISTT